MLAMSIALIVVSASPMKHYREGKVERAARLMTNEERAQLASFNVQLDNLHRPAANQLLLTGSIFVMSAAVVVPVVAGAIGFVGSVFLGIFGFLGPTLWTLIPEMWVALFAWIPVWGWIAMGVAAVAGVAMLFSAQAADAPRRDQVEAVTLERRRLVNQAASRPDMQVVAPPLVTF
jgi:hypothetical protein